MTFSYIIHDLIWDYCIKMPHCCSVELPFHIKSDKDIKSTSQAIFRWSEAVEKWSWKLAINIQTVITSEKGGMISLTRNTESPFDWSSKDKSCIRNSNLLCNGYCNGRLLWKIHVKVHACCTGAGALLQIWRWNVKKKKTALNVLIMSRQFGDTQ